MKLLLLHLSDIHIKDDKNPALNRYKEIGSTVISIAPEVSVIFIVITGDIAYSGIKEEYILATAFINNLINHIQQSSNVSSIPIHVLMVPGNHDGEFKSSGNARNGTIDNVRKEGENYIDDGVIALCTEPQNQYFEFERQFSGDNLVLNDPLWKEYLFNIDGQSIRFSAINASWMSQVPEVQGKLVLPIRKYSSVINEDASIKIALLHHPLNWYAQETYHPLRDLCRLNYQIVMTGHEHLNSTYITTDNEGYQTTNLEAGALVAHDGKSSVFSIITVDMNKQHFAVEEFVWVKSMYEPTNGPAIWNSYMPLPISRPNKFQISDFMKEKLESLGATFYHPHLDSLHLSDVFVYPDLLEVDSNDDQNENVNSSILSKELENLEKVLILGEEQFGKSSLLSHLYKQYHNANYVPILLDAHELKSATEDQFSRIINRNFEVQYGKDHLNKYLQTDYNKKIALVDNIDKLGVRGDILARVVNHLNKHFKFLILTADDKFDVTLISSTEASQSLKPFKFYKMLGFGYKLRNELIRKWQQAGSDLTHDELQERVHSAEQVINSILGKGLVPMTAFNVLVLLQTLESNQKGALANAGLAQYYEYLIRRGFFHANIKGDEFDEILSYLSHLAWKMYQLKSKSIEELDLEKFNITFSDEVHKTSLMERLAILEKGKILVKKNGEYSFSHPYLEYFFVARYMATNLEDNDELKAKVIHICRHLYIKENANIILFLTHHSSDRWIVKEIASVLSELLSETSPLNLETDTRLINSLVNEKARIAVDASNHVENQKQVRENDDKISVYKEPELASELSSIKELDQLAQLNLLFKTSEILGQILKNRYGSLSKEFKNELLKTLFDAPLRAINFFVDIVNNIPESLLSEISDRIQSKVPSVDKEKSHETAKKFIFSVVGNVADAFLSRQGEIIGSPKLKDSIEDVANKNDGVTYKLVSISAQLSYPNHAPIAQIKKISKDLESNYFGYKILQGLAARHMYMYSLPLTERQELASAVSIDVHNQRGIELRSGNIKKLKGRSNVSHHQSLIANLKESFFLNNKSVKATLARYGKNDKTNIYQMYISNGNKAGFLVRRNSWSDETATIISIEGKTEGILDGTAPYFNHAKVIACMNETGDLIEISDPDSYNYARIYLDKV